MQKFRYIVIVAGGVAAVVAASRAEAARPKDKAQAVAGGAAHESQQALIETLRTGEAPQKALACKQLAVWGDKQAVPALAPLLLDPQLISWARTALEAIDDPAAAQALRDALGKVHGRQLVGVINSIGVKRDAAAVDSLVALLKDADADVASAAATALGHVGGTAAAKALEQSLAGSAAAVVGSVAEGCVLCAEKFLADGKTDQSVRLYDLVRKSSAPKQRILEGTRGAILARGSAGLPILIETLRSSDKAMLNLGLGTCREMPGSAVTDALVAELGRATPDRQALLVLAVADRGGPSALAAVLAAAKAGPEKVRLAAIRSLKRIGDASCAPVLLDAAMGSSPELAQTAMSVLADLPAKEVDDAVVAQLQKAEGKMRLVLIELAGQRHIEAAMPALLKAAGDADAQVRLAAIAALGSTVGPGDLGLLVGRTAKPGDAQEAAAAWKALGAAAVRMPDREACADKLIGAMASAPVASKCSLLEIVGAVGGDTALRAVSAGAKSADAQVQDAAYRVLGEWTTSDAAPQLLALSKESGNDKLQVRALRGYLRIARQFDIPNAQRLAMYREGLATARRDDERRLAVEVLLRIRTPESLTLAVGHLGDPALRETAGRVAIGISDKIVAGHAMAVAQAMTKVIATTKNKDVGAKAKALLDRATKGK